MQGGRCKEDNARRSLQGGAVVGALEERVRKTQDCVRAVTQPGRGGRCDKTGVIVVR